ncbi:hypothetical protein AB0758_46980 [Tolypothrix bouteillei VB521301_2]|uniref:hypothetical protein n=1 Tax=Tolypothrix bouteillei TaxID=1246981 RepID=UPI0038B5F2BB
MIATITEPQWFIVRGWLDNQEWGDEPPDPDDLWAVGDRVRLRNSTVEGTVLLNENQPFLGSYLPYVLVQWDNKSFSVPIEPELLVRLTRLIPPGLTWKASQSFNDVGDEPEPHLDDIFTFSSDIPPSVKVEDKTLDLTEPETVLMVEDLTVSTRVEQPKLETVLMVEDLTVSTRVEQPKLETVLMVEDLTVSTRVEQPS